MFNNASVLYVNIWSIAAQGMDVDRFKMIPDNKITILDVAGVIVFLLGFMIEVCADRQLANHLAHPRPGTGKFIKSGLWRYSRHPNYFGEAVIWWGIFLIACNVKYGWATFFAPAFINILLRFVSGVPFPEKKYATNPEWMHYCKETNVFCLFYKNVSTEDQFI